MTTFVLPRRDLAAVPFLSLLRGFGHVLMAAFIFFACFAFSDTSPYDIVAIRRSCSGSCSACGCTGAGVPLVLVLLVFVGATVVALMPYLDEDLPPVWTVQLCYLAVTGIFFAMFFSDDSDRRSRPPSRSTPPARCSAQPRHRRLSRADRQREAVQHVGRASGTFQDPNVFGSFLSLARST